VLSLDPLCGRLSEVDVAGVVADDASVDEDFLRDTEPLASSSLLWLCPFLLLPPWLNMLPTFSLVSALDLRRKVLRKEGIVARVPKPGEVYGHIGG
jgi:hypothetical protein